MECLRHLLLVLFEGRKSSMVGCGHAWNTHSDVAERHRLALYIFLEPHICPWDTLPMEQVKCRKLSRLCILLDAHFFSFVQCDAGVVRRLAYHIRQYSLLEIWFLSPDICLLFL